VNKRVIITGASSGIGKTLAIRMKSLGYEVIGISRRNPDTDMDFYECDLSNVESIESFAERYIEEVGELDILINCAGVGTGGAIEYNSYEDILWVHQVNVMGLIELTNKLLPLLKNSKGRIINVGSVAGEIAIPFQTIYSMTKASIMKYTEGLRMELKPFGVQVSTVLPGDTKTDFTGNRKTINPPNNAYYERVDRSIKKMENDEQNGVSPEKVAKLVLKLLRKKRMPIHRIVGIDYKILVFLSKILPKRFVELIIYNMYGK